MTGLGKDPVAAQLEQVEARLGQLETDNAGSVEAAVGNVASGLSGEFGSMSGQFEELVSTLGGLQESVSGTLGSVNETLSGARDQMETVATAMGNVDSRLASFGERIGGLDQRLAEVDQRLVAVEQRPLVESSDTARAAFDSYERQLEELRAILAQQREDADGLEQRLTDISAASAAELTAMQEAAQEDLASAQDAAAAQVAAAEERPTEPAQPALVAEPPAQGQRSGVVALVGFDGERRERLGFGQGPARAPPADQIAHRDGVATVQHRQRHAHAAHPVPEPAAVSDQPDPLCIGADQLRRRCRAEKGETAHAVMLHRQGRHVLGPPSGAGHGSAQSQSLAEPECPVLRQGCQELGLPAEPPPEPEKLQRRTVDAQIRRIGRRQLRLGHRQQPVIEIDHQRLGIAQVEGRLGQGRGGHGGPRSQGPPQHDRAPLIFGCRRLWPEPPLRTT